MKSVLVAALAGIAVTLASPALGQTLEQRKAACDDTLGNHLPTEQQVDACTTLIESGTLAGADLADAYFQRGLDYNVMLDLQHALTDFNSALQLKPDYAEALSNRGTTFRELRQYKNAIADFNAYLAMKPADAAVYAERAKAEQDSGDSLSAEGDMTKACSLDSYYCN